MVDGILHFQAKKELRDNLGDDPMSRVLVVSEFPPRLRWKAHNAMTRNRTICGLADALVVVESGTEGGTFEAGKTALSLNEPLFCVDYATPVPSAEGNRYFLENGAGSLKPTKSGRPNLDELLATVTEGPVGNRQQELLLNDAS
jgi:predicted Rossmann fold nucleotide-binding protein DprA/Smf involved in DNA uptake